MHDGMHIHAGRMDAYEVTYIFNWDRSVENKYYLFVLTWLNLEFASKRQSLHYLVIATLRKRPVIDKVKISSKSWCDI